MADENEMPRLQTLMAGLHYESGDQWRFTIDSIDVLRDALGHDLTNAFVRCFAPSIAS